MSLAYDSFTLPPEPDAALIALRALSKDDPVLVFKQSPICPVSHRALARYRAWLTGHRGARVKSTEIDVLAERALARGLVALLGIPHESPQVLVFKGGQVVWHGSHEGISANALSSALKNPPR
jgi:bacillithiol system protein YtxJ